MTVKISHYHFTTGSIYVTIFESYISMVLNYNALKLDVVEFEFMMSQTSVLIFGFKKHINCDKPYQSSLTINIYIQ